ncbi:MAG: PAS domain-containing protein [Chloroflexi bacterium]|nr:PAS domain-containing protein [Chloroflexota bacterium]
MMPQHALERAVRQLSESQGMLSAVLDNTINGIILVGVDMQVLYANRRMEDLFGLEPGAAIGRDKREVADRRLADQVVNPEDFLQRLYYLYDHFEETAIDEIEVARPSHRILERYSSPVFKQDASLLGRIEVYSDVTEVRQLQRDKDEFLSLISHELRTPVTSIKGYAQLLQRRARREATAGHTLQAYDAIERQASRMQELIDILLDLSRLETGRLQLQLGDVDLNELVPRVVGMVEVMSDRHRFDVHLPPDSTRIRADERRMEQVLLNLLTNAVRFSPDGGTVTTRLDQEEDLVRLSVTDQGYGIAPDAQERIFERFYRAGQVPEATGMGIGLYITKGIVEQHGGWIAVDSAPGRGSTFTVHLPRAVAVQPGRGPDTLG